MTVSGNWRITFEEEDSHVNGLIGRRLPDIGGQEKIGIATLQLKAISKRPA